MQERRRAKRLPIKLSLDIINLYKQDNVLVNNINAPIEVVNISKTGIGFRSTSILPEGYYFNASIAIENGDTLHSVIKIVRSQPEDDKYTMYGCEFVGMATVLSYIFDDFENKMITE